jgi:hypothetical protein
MTTTAPTPQKKSRKDYIEQLSRTLIAEQVSFTQYSIMLAIVDFMQKSAQQGPMEEPPINQVAVHLGLTYHAVRNQALRSPWLAIRHKDHQRITLSQDGIVKFQKVHKRMKEEEQAA